MISENTIDNRISLIRIIISGGIASLLLIGLNFYSTFHLEHFNMVRNQLSMGGRTFALFLTLIWLPLIGRWVPFLNLSKKELVFSICLIYLASSIAYEGILSHLLNYITLPKADIVRHLSWQKSGWLNFIPNILFPNKGAVTDTVQEGFRSGLSNTESMIPLLNVPWKAWSSTLLVWIPFVFIFFVMCISVYMMVHKQWSSYEQLSYPIPSILQTLIARDHTRNISKILLDRLFWIGFFIVFFLQLYNYMATLFPGRLDLIEFKWSLLGITKYFPNIQKVGVLSKLQNFTIFFPPLVIAYFTTTELSFTVGFSYIFYTIFATQFFLITGTPPQQVHIANLQAGGYLFYFGLLLFLGRNYYFPLFKKAFLFWQKDESNKDGIFAARIFLLSFCIFNAILILLGMDWFTAVLCTMTILIILLVFTRITCEIGIPFMQASFQPGVIFIKFFGASFFGPAYLTLSYYITSIFTADAKANIMTFTSTAYKLADNNNINRNKYYGLSFSAILVFLCFGFFILIWQHYSYGSTSQPFLANRYHLEFQQLPKAIIELKDLNLMEVTKEAGLLSRFKFLNPDSTSLLYFFSGGIIILILFMLRARFSWWPIHPALIIILNTHPSKVMWASFLIGWIIKIMVIKFAGGKVYNRLKPFFVGILLGSAAMWLISILVGFIQLLVTGYPPPVTFKDFFF